MKETQNLIAIHGTPLTLIGTTIKVGDIAPEFTATAADGKDVTLAEFKGKRIVISVFPSIDTPVCAQSEREFNKRAAALGSVVILSISKDLPFALGRFCAAEGISAVHPLSDYKNSDFGHKYGFLIKENMLLSRGVVVINTDGKVGYVEYVHEITNEPNYSALEAFLKA